MSNFLNKHNKIVSRTILQFVKKGNYYDETVKWWDEKRKAVLNS